MSPQFVKNYGGLTGCARFLHEVTAAILIRGAGRRGVLPSPPRCRLERGLKTDRHDVAATTAPARWPSSSHGRLDAVIGAVGSVSGGMGVVIVNGKIHRLVGRVDALKSTMQTDAGRTHADRRSARGPPSQLPPVTDQDEGARGAAVESAADTW